MAESYVANSVFTGNGSPFDGGKVVYKGPISPQTITGLTNGTTLLFSRIHPRWAPLGQLACKPVLRQRDRHPAPFLYGQRHDLAGSMAECHRYGHGGHSGQHPPNQTNQLTSFEAPTNQGDTFGERLRGYICAPETGNYTFWIASDNESDLYLSTDDNPANKVKIAYMTGYVAPRIWTKYPTQKSALIPLTAGTNTTSKPCTRK